MTRTLCYFIAGSALGWLLIAGLCFARWQSGGLVSSSVTGVICIAPTFASLFLTLRSADKAGAEQLFAVFGGMFLRMGAALGLGVAIFLAIPYFREPGNQYAYWGSLLLFYLFTLGLETLLAARYKPESRANRASGVRT